PCECGGVGSLPGATRTRITPTSFVPAARPRNCHVASISPFARWWRSTSSQCAVPTEGSLRLGDVHREGAAAGEPLHLQRQSALAADLVPDGRAACDQCRSVVEREPHPGLRRRDEVRREGAVELRLHAERARETDSERTGQR